MCSEKKRRLPLIAVPYIFWRTLQTLLRWSQPQAATRLANLLGGHIELFLPFYAWHDARGRFNWRAWEKYCRHEARLRWQPVRVVHAAYSGPRFIRGRLRMNAAVPEKLGDNVARLHREFSLLQHLRERQQGTPERFIFVLHGGQHPPGQARQGKETLLKLLERILPAARQAGVTLALENTHGRRGMRETVVGGRIAQLGELFSCLPAHWRKEGWLGWTFDPSHALIHYQGETKVITRELKALAADCVHVHLNFPRLIRRPDGSFYWRPSNDAQRARVVPPFDKAWWQWLRILYEKGQLAERGVVTLEVIWAPRGMRWRYGSPLRDIELLVHQVRRFLADLPPSPSVYGGEDVEKKR